MKRLIRTDSSIEHLKLLAEHSKKRSISRYDTAAISDFVAGLERTLGFSTNAEHRVRGLRAEEMFMTVVAGMGKIALIKTEDTGELYYSGDELLVPDFRVVTSDNTQLLIEVKCNSGSKWPLRAFKLSDSYMRKLLRYSERTQAALRIAIFWEHLGWWTLNRPESFEAGIPHVKQWSISFESAFATNEMTAFGDRTIATVPPLRFRVALDPNKSDSVGPESEGTFKLAVKSCRILANDKPLSGESARLAWRLIWYGTWQEFEPKYHYSDGKMLGFDFAYAPRGWEEGMPEFQGMIPIGSLSEMISAAYLRGASGIIHTTSSDGILKPGATATFIPDDLHALEFPVAVLILEPNFEYKPGAPTGAVTEDDG